MKLLVLADIYPSKENPVSGVFVKEQVEQLKMHHDIRVMVIGRRFVRVGSRAFPKYMFSNLMGRIEGRKNKEDGQEIIRIEYPVFVITGRPLHIFNGISAYLAVFSKLNEMGFRPDLIYAHKSFPAGYAGWKIKSKTNVPVVTMEFQGPFSSYFDEPYLGDRVVSTINNVDRTVYIEFQLKEIMSCGVKRERLGVAHYGIDTDKFFLDREGVKRRKGETARGRFKLLVVGRVEEKKGIRYLLEAIQILKKEFPHIHLSIAGPVDKGGEEILDSIRKMRLEDNIHYKGICPNSELPLLINAHDILVSASLFETFGITLLEAMACGKPVVATKSGGPAETVNDKVGVLVEKANPQALADGIRHVMENYEGYNQEGIREYVVKNFSHEAAIKRLNGIFEEVLRGK